MTTHQAYFLLVDLALILLATRLAGSLAERLRQPRVIGEMAAGILLGPTLFHGGLSKALFPADTRPLLSALANLGVAVFMFLVGLELDHRKVRGNSTAALTTSIGAIVLPFGIGFGIAFVLREPDSSMPGFALYIGTALSITAFPVLARILRDRNLHRTEIGGLALTCAALADLAAWTILAGVIATLGASQHQWRLILVVPYLLVMLFVVRPLLRRLALREPSLTGIVTVIAGLLLSAACTEWLGLHFIFGAFFFGVLMPRAGAERLTHVIHERVDTFSTTLLLPIFFVMAGLQVNLSGLTAAGLGELALILAAAIVGKLGGAYLGARLGRKPHREAAVLASLMNTRGLTELIVLSLGLQLGIIDGYLYSLLVVMALVTTAMTGPLLTLLLGTTGLGDATKPVPEPGRAVGHVDAGSDLTLVQLGEHLGPNPEQLFDGDVAQGKQNGLPQAPVVRRE
ncbi:cation/H(+) antiporter [Kribbella antibiotica]|uniref:Cation/H(+) antiporter n=1 Tax=Kribbella antibiotica TaxID=190195 RepID=A0A4R4ZM07_9ACTN|nr:cation/H(+) antiporter [Kribbella antibiotica]